MQDEALDLTWGPVKGAEEPLGGETKGATKGRREPRPGAVYGIASGVVTLAGRSYAWTLPVINPYLPVEQGTDREALRKWQIAVVTDLLRRGVTDSSACRTVRQWAELHWTTVHTFLSVRKRSRWALGIQFPKNAPEHRQSLVLSYLALHSEGLTPPLFRGPPPVRVTRRARLRPLRIVHPETGAILSPPPMLRIERYQAIYPGHPLPAHAKKTTRVHYDYRGLWRGSEGHRLSGQRGGRPKQKAYLEARQAAETAETEKGA